MVGMFLALAVGAALSATGPANSGDNYPHSVTVSYADLDLSTAAGRNLLNKRVYSAAAHICGIDDYSQLPDLQEVAACSAHIAHETRPVVASTIAAQMNGHASLMAATGIIAK